MQGGVPYRAPAGCLDDFYRFNRIHSLGGLVGWAGARGWVCCVILAGYLVGLVDGLFVLLGGWDCELWRLEAVILVLYDRDVAMDGLITISWLIAETRMVMGGEGVCLTRLIGLCWCCRCF